MQSRGRGVPRDVPSDDDVVAPDRPGEVLDLRDPASAREGEVVRLGTVWSGVDLGEIDRRGRVDVDAEREVPARRPPDLHVPDREAARAADVDLPDSDHIRPG